METSLDLSLDFLPRTISKILEQVSEIRESYKKLSNIDDLLERLEDEMRKIDAFKRELPLSMLLLNDAIVKLKEESVKLKDQKDLTLEKKNCEESDWLSSAQLWTSNFNFNSKSELIPSSEEKGGGGGGEGEGEDRIQEWSWKNRGGAAFEQFKVVGSGFKRMSRKLVKGNDKEGLEVTDLSLMTPISEVETGNLNAKINVSFRAGIGTRKQRRSWSPHLHRLFVDALHRLGGSQEATPKQIRELMQIDGLTNDEVKSHLQKYRLHVRKQTLEGANIWPLRSRRLDDSETNKSLSGSPEGLCLSDRPAKALSITEQDSINEADQEDDKSDGYWK